MIPYCDFLELFKNKKSIFFLGVGGISMSALAFTAKAAGAVAAGYDSTPSPLTEKLAASGIPVVYRFSESSYDGVDLVVYTGAIHDNDPNLAYPRSLGIPEMTRAEFLGFLMKKSRNPIGVAGTHGKSTTTGFLASIFLAADDRDPTIMLGAEMSALSGTYRIGTGEDFIFEACEYQNSFLNFYPRLALILNAEYDHADFFPNLESVYDSFTRFADLAKDGTAIFNFDNRGARIVAERTVSPVFFFSLHEKKDLWCEELTAENGFYRFRLCTADWQIPVKLRLPGLHNVANALAAASAAVLSCISPETIRAGLESFGGVKRRFEARGFCNHLRVFDDYAHHPDEIRATLTMAKTLGFEKILVVFQSHTFTRTQAYWDDFVSSLSLADEVIVMDIYPAREEPIPGITAENLAKAIPCGRYVGNADAIVQNLLQRKESGLCIIMGAGNIIQLTDRILTDRGKV